MLSRTTLRNLTILAGSATSILAAMAISPALPEMAEAFSGTPNADFLVRLTLSMPALFIAVGSLFAGDLLDRWGRKPVLIVSLLLYGLAGTAAFFMDSLSAILVSRAFLGLAVAGIMSGFTTLILDYFEGSELNRFLGLQGAVIGMGGMVFLYLAGLLADIGWQYPFLIHLYAFLVLPGVLLFIDEPEKAAVDSDAPIKKVSFPWRKFAPVYATAFVGMAIFYIFPVQIPFYLAANGGSSSSQIGLALSLQTLASVIFALQYQHLKARYSFYAIFSFAFLTFSISYLIVAASAAYAIVTIGLFIGGIGIGLFPISSSGWLAALAPAAVRGKAVGGLTSMFFLGQFFSPVISQPLVSRIGFSATFVLTGAAALLIALLFAVGAARQKQAAVPLVDPSN